LTSVVTSVVGLGGGLAMLLRYPLTPFFSAIACCSCGESVRASWRRRLGGRERMDETCEGVWKVCEGEGIDGGRTGKVGSERGASGGGDTRVERAFFASDVGSWAGGIAWVAVVDAE
jgi:hypothetical protein